MAEGRLMIFTAVALEARAIRRATADLRLGADVQIVGIGAVHAPVRLEPPLPSLIIMAGLAGGLDPSLGVGDVVIDAGGLDLPIISSARGGRITTADRIVATPSDKAALFAATGAMAADMEQRQVAQRAAGWGVPCVGVRAISDTAAETLDPAVLALVDSRGRLRPARLAAPLLRRPSLIPYLRRLGRNSNFAADRLGRAVREIAVAWAAR